MRQLQQPRKTRCNSQRLRERAGATLNLSADEDGIHSDNDDVLLGNIYLTSTNITVNAGRRW